MSGFFVASCAKQKISFSLTYVVMHYARPHEALLQCLFPLNTPVRQLANLRRLERVNAYLVTVELAPLAAVVLVEERENHDRVHEVDERVSAVALILQSVMTQERSPWGRWASRKNRRG